MGKVLRVFPKSNGVLVEGINLIKKHMRRTREDIPGGIITKEAPLHYSNVQLICPRCNKLFEGFSAISRRDNKTEICNSCGTEEALFDFKISRLIDKEKSWLNRK